MRYRDIIRNIPTCDSHPVTVVLPLHPTRWSEFCKFISNSPTEFRLLSKLTPDLTGWIVYIGCKTEAARDQLNEAWA